MGYGSPDPYPIFSLSFAYSQDCRYLCVIMESELYRPEDLSSASMREIAMNAEKKYTLLALTADRISLTAESRQRWERIMDMSGAPFSYCHFTEPDGTCHSLIPYQPGSLRDDFDFGPLVMLRTEILKSFLREARPDYRFAGWYDLRLFATTTASPLLIPEPLYAIDRKDGEKSGEEIHFAYVDPRNRAYQLEMEKAVTGFLAGCGALIRPTDLKEIHDCDCSFPVEASVVIPVRNRVRTIADAVESALSQEVPFDFNVIVVDNRSTDGTTELLSRMADVDNRLKVITTSTLPDPAPGIGGCWNIALNSPHCGRYAVQLDSDDLYSSPQTLRKIVDRFKEDDCAMVIGSYTLTDIDGNILPPGLIDHREWTDSNGPNNALRINGLGAPRAFFTPVARLIGFPDVCYGEDYAMGLAISRSYRIGRIYESLYLCRRWEDNTDHSLSLERINRNNYYKDFIRSYELAIRKKR